MSGSKRTRKGPVRLGTNDTLFGSVGSMSSELDFDVSEPESDDSSLVGVEDDFCK